MDKHEPVRQALADPGQVENFEYRERAGNEPSYTYKVPANTRWLLIEAIGGSGGYSTGGESGGPGGGSVLTGLVPVVPEETLSIYIGDGAFRGYQGRPGYRPGGDGGSAPRPIPSNGGGGGGSTAVVDAKGEVLIHAAGGGGSGGRGGFGNFTHGGTGGSAGLDPGNGTNGEGSDPTSPGGRGGNGGDRKLTERGGRGGGGATGGGGGGGGGGLYCGDGGGAGAGVTGGGGGGGGGGASDIVASAIGVTESRKSPIVGHVTIRPQATVLSTVASAAFGNVFLRMDGKGVTPENPIGGVVNCQYTAGTGQHLEHFYVRPQADGTVGIEAEEFPDIYLRIDGTGLSRQNPTGAGVVNCRYGTDAMTFFKIVAHPDRLLAIESVAFPGVFLGMDGNGVDRVLPNGGGKVYCRFDAMSWEVFRMPAP